MPLPLLNYPLAIQKLIRRLDTPAKAQRWLQTLEYNPANTMRTIIGATRHHQAHCLEGVMTAAAILEHHGYPPLVLDLVSTDKLDHTLFIFQQGGKWGAVGKSRDIGLDGRRPVFTSIKALARSYVIPYIDQKAHITAFGVLDLRALGNQAWRTSSKNVWYVEESLRTMPHQKLITPSSTVRRWRKRFVAFRKIHPKSQPDYFPDRQYWW